MLRVGGALVLNTDVRGNNAGDFCVGGLCEERGPRGCKYASVTQGVRQSSVHAWVACGGSSSVEERHPDGGKTRQ